MAKILVIEDSPTNMKLTCLILNNFGHTVVRAVDAETGLNLVKSEKPDLILMDIQLPGMDGFMATALLKKDLSSVWIPVVAITALVMKADHESSLVAGCDAYIAKPFHYRELNGVINSLLQKDKFLPLSTFVDHPRNHDLT